MKICHHNSSLDPDHQSAAWSTGASALAETTARIFDNSLILAQRNTTRIDEDALSILRIERLEGDTLVLWFVEPGVTRMRRPPAATGCLRRPKQRKGEYPRLSHSNVLVNLRCDGLTILAVRRSSCLYGAARQRKCGTGGGRSGGRTIGPLFTVSKSDCAANADSTGQILQGGKWGRTHTVAFDCAFDSLLDESICK